MATVFAGLPENYPELTEWDAECGFDAGDAVVALRRDEDTRALACLGAEPRWLHFIDRQYDEQRPSPNEIAEEIAEFADGRFDTIAFPLGIEHPDHRLTHAACRVLLEERFGLARHWIAWADVPYRARWPRLFEECLESLRSAGFLLEPRVARRDIGLAARKADAVAEYPTQLVGLGVDSVADTERPEQLYLVRRQ